MNFSYYLLVEWYWYEIKKGKNYCKYYNYCNACYVCCISRH